MEDHGVEEVVGVAHYVTLDLPRAVLVRLVVNTIDRLVVVVLSTAALVYDNCLLLALLVFFLRGLEWDQGLWLTLRLKGRRGFLRQ